MLFERLTTSAAIGAAYDWAGRGRLNLALMWEGPNGRDFSH